MADANHLPTNLDERTVSRQSVDKRLANAKTPAEVVLWTQVRGEVLRQDEDAADRHQRRWMERASLYATVGLSLVGVSAGVILLATQHPLAGLFALGAGLYRLAPEFTRDFLTRREQKPNDHQG